MRDDGFESDAASAQSRQFGVGAMFIGLTLAGVGFALVRLLELDGIVRRLMADFLESPGRSLMNLGIFGLYAWGAARFFRARIVEAAFESPLIGALWGTIQGGVLFGMLVGAGLEPTQLPHVFAVAVFICGIIGAGWALLPAVFAGIPAIPLIRVARTPWRAAALGAGVGGLAGFLSLGVFGITESRFVRFALLPAFIGAACGARGAFLQATHHRRLRPNRRWIAMQSSRATYETPSSGAEGMDSSTGSKETRA